MMKTKRYFIASVLLGLIFAIFTILVATVDVANIGPEGSAVGFSTLNQFFHQNLGGNPFWYQMTEWIGIIAILVMASFALIGLRQLIHCKDLRRVEGGILLMGALYALLIVVYAFFEMVVVNYRPVLMEGHLEASYPSSHTMLTVCVSISAAMRMRVRFPEKRWLWLGGCIGAGVLSAGTVVGRLLSGVHWFTDIVGAVLLSAALLTLYRSGMELLREASVKE